MFAYHPSSYRDRPIRIAKSRKSFTRLPFHVGAEVHLYYAGDESPGLFEVRTGLFRLSRVTQDGRRYVVGFGYPGDVIGFCPDGAHLSDCEALVDSNLYSTSTRDGVVEKICRTFSVVCIEPFAPGLVESEHDAVMRGGSIGAIFKAHGWDIAKETLHTGPLTLPTVNSSWKYSVLIT